jgi:DNA polymerase I-like protein with 3'-5' exonuclease and polymerase domains
MDAITIDFETYYSREYSLTKHTTEGYINDFKFEVIGVAVKVNDEPTEWFSGTMQETKTWLKQFDWDNSIVIAHNALFDAPILTWKFGINPKAIVCTLCMGRALHSSEVGGSLATLGEHYSVGVKGTEVVNALGKRRVDFSEPELDAYASYCINDVDMAYRLFRKMLPKFTVNELKLIDMTIKMFSDPVLHLDNDVLVAHLQDVQDEKERLLAECSVDKAELMSNQKLANVLEELGVDIPMKTNAKGKLTYAFAKTDEAFKALAEHDDPKVQAIVAARLGTKSTLEETRTQRFIDIANRPGRNALIPVPLQYYGARTGRWAATDSINLQNLPRKSKLKQAIVAPKGHVIVGADLSNIELRVGLCFAGQMDKLKLLADGVDLYKDFASTVYNIPIEEVNDTQRFMGKTSQLSLIYGTGATKLRNQVKLMGKVDIGEVEAKRIVRLYRDEYTGVVSAWEQGEEALYAVYNNTHAAMGKDDLIAIHGNAGALLPSGLYMRYPDLKYSDTVENNRVRREWSVLKRRNERDKLYGSKVFQGLTQAMARCIMAESMLRIGKEHKVALCIHDAVYLVAPENEADDVLRLVIAQLKIPPAWMPEVPLDAEGGYGHSLDFKMHKVM